MDASSKATHALQRAARPARTLWMAGALVALILALSLAKTDANNKQTTNEDGACVHPSVRPRSPYDCGFDRRGADEAIARHQMNTLRPAYQLAAHSRRALSPRSYDENNI